MKLIRYIVRLYLSKFPITEDKKYIYVFEKKYLLPARSNINSQKKHGFYLKLNLNNPEHQYYYFFRYDQKYCFIFRASTLTFEIKVI